jgi:hypothetical protein
MKLILDSVLLHQPIPGFLGPVLSPFAANRITLAERDGGGAGPPGRARGLVCYYRSSWPLGSASRSPPICAWISHRHLQLLSFRFHDRRRTGDLIARLIGDIRYPPGHLRRNASGMAEGSLVVGMLIVMFFMD